MHVRKATSKIRSLVGKVNKEVSSLGSLGFGTTRRKKSQSLRAEGSTVRVTAASRESLAGGSCTEPAHSSQHSTRLPEACDEVPLDQCECTMSLPAAIKVHRVTFQLTQENINKKIGKPAHFKRITPPNPLYVMLLLQRRPFADTLGRANIH